MLNFATLEHDKYYLLSNTAHLNLSLFQMIVGKTWLRSWNQEKIPQVVNLVEFVTDEVIKKNYFHKILILGTLTAYKYKLYPSYFLKNGLSENDFYTLSEEDFTTIQECIDNIKQGRFEESGKKISKLVVDAIKQIRASGKEVNEVLCGCTEIPLALKSRWNLEHKLAELGEESPIFIDTAELFARKIAQDINEMCR